MNLLVLLAISAAAVLVLTVWNRVLTHRLPDSDSKDAAIVLFAGCALTGFLRYVALVALVTYSVMLGVLVAAQTITGPLQTEAMVAAIGRAKQLQAWLSTFSGIGSYLIWAVVIIALSYWIYHRAHTIGKIALGECLPDEADAEVKAPEDGRAASSGNRALGILFSRGTLSILGKGSKTLALAGFVCTLVSIVAAESNGILETRIFYLWELTIERSQPQAQASWEKLKRNAPDDPQAQADPEAGGDDARNRDETEIADASRYLASLFERAFIEDLRSDLPKPSPKAVEDLQQLGTRASILQEFVRTAGRSRSVTMEPALSQANNLGESERAAISRFEQVQLGGSTNSALGELARNDIQTELEKAPPSIRNAIIERARAWRASLSEPARPVDFIGQAVGDAAGKLIGDSVKALVNPGEDVLRQLGAKAASKTIRSGLHRLYKARLAGLLTRTAAGESPRTGLAETLQRELERPLILREERAAIGEAAREAAGGAPNMEATLKKLRLSRPTLIVDPTSEEFARTAKDLEQTLREGGGRYSRVRLAAALTSYSDLFPGQSASTARTARTRWMGEVPGEQPVLMSRGFDFQRVQHLAKVGRRIYRPPPRRIEPPGGRWPGQGGRDPFNLSKIERLTMEKAAVEEKLEQIAEKQAEAERPEKSIDATYRFDSASLHSKVGGVVIGRGPALEGSEELDFRNLHWKPSGDRLSLMLERPDGSLLEVPGTFERELVQQALAFAADGRPVAVTMIQSWPLGRLKVLLHPALVDSRLGRDAIDLDSAVDRYFSVPARLAAIERLNDAVALYEFARTRIRRTVASDYVSALEPQRRGLQARSTAISTEIASLETPGLNILEDFRTWNQSPYSAGSDRLVTSPISPFTEHLERLLRQVTPPGTLLPLFPSTDGDLVSPGRVGEASSREEPRRATPRGIQPANWLVSHAVFAERPDVFDPLVVSTLSKCADSPHLDALEACLESNVRTERSDLEQEETRDKLRGQVSALTAAHHAVGVVSGVREQIFRTDSELSFLQPPATDRARGMLWPFDFVLRVTFTRLAAARPDEEPAKQEVPSLALPGIEQGAIEAAIRDALVGAPELAASLERTRELTVLQRLFRLGLNGGLGENFPGYRLVELGRAVAGTPVEQVPTPRWIEPLHTTGETRLVNASEI